jgi:hypothetical protein
VRTDTSDEPSAAAAGDPAAGVAGDGSGEDPGAGRGLPVGLVVAVAVVGLALRIAILLSPLGRPDSDEVITALMARNVGGDGFPTFFWGQHYGGTIELVPVLASLKVFGWSVGAMRVPTLVLAAVNAVLVWRIGRRGLHERRAQLAGLLVWLGPPAALWFGGREQLFYAPTVTLGLVLGLAAYRVRAAGRACDYAVIGLVLGLGLWTSTNISYFVLAALVVALDGRRPADRVREVLIGAPVAVAALVLGAWPLISDYLASDGAPMEIAAKFPTTGTYPSRWVYFFAVALPGALGFRAVFTHDWIGGPLGVLAYGAVLAVLAVAVRRSWPFTAGREGLLWAAVGLAAYPFVYAAIPFVMDDGNLRYTFFVIPFVALVLVRAVDTQRAAVIALALTLVVSLVGLGRMYVISEVDDLGYRVGNVGDLVPVIDVLDRAGVDAVYADYWVAYRLAFETEERVVVATTWGVPRYAPYVESVRASDRSAWVVDDGVQLDELRRGLERLGVQAEVIDAGDFAVVIPERNVDTMEVPEAARHPA